MLMHPDDTPVNHQVFKVGLACQRFKHLPPDAALRPTAISHIGPVPVAIGWW